MELEPRAGPGDLPRCPADRVPGQVGNSNLRSAFQATSQLSIRPLMTNRAYLRRAGGLPRPACGRKAT